MKKLSLFILFILWTACGSVEPVVPTEKDPTPDPVPTESTGPTNAYLFATEFGVASGQLYTANLAEPELVNSQVTSLGSSAVIYYFDNLLYVLHDGYSQTSYNNVQIIDPSDFSIVNQFPTGINTNPFDIIVVDQTAYISLNDAFDGAADVIVMNLDTGEITDQISFSDDLYSGSARANQMVRNGDFIYVALGDTDNILDFDNPGKIGVINILNNTVEQVIVLKGKNPFDIQYSPSLNKLFVAHADIFHPSGDFGGIEIVPLDDPSSSILIDDQELGGYIEKLVYFDPDPDVDGDATLLAVASEYDFAHNLFISDVLKMNEDFTSATDVSIFLSGNADVRVVAVDLEKRVWVGSRTISSDTGFAEDPKVELYDLETGESTKIMKPLIPVTSIVFEN